MNSIVTRKKIIVCLTFLVVSLLALTGSAYSITVDSPQFSPDGKKLVLGIRADWDSGIYNINLEDMSFHRLVTTPADTNDFNPFVFDGC